MIVKYSKKFPYAPYLNEDIGFEEDFPTLSIFNEKEIMAVLETMHKVAVKFHEKNNPHLKYDEIPQGEKPISTYDISQEKKAIEVENAIANAKNKDELYSLQKDAMKYGLANQYKEKLKLFV